MCILCLLSSYIYVCIMEKFDQRMSNNVMIVKKRACNMKAFCDRIGECKRKLQENREQTQKVVKLVANGPAVAVECRNFTDTKSISDKLRTLIWKGEGSVIAGTTPMKQLVETVPNTCLNTLIEMTDPNGGKGKGKNRIFTVWWPIRPSDP